MLACINWNFNL